MNKNENENERLDSFLEKLICTQYYCFKCFPFFYFVVVVVLFRILFGTMATFSLLCHIAFHFVHGYSLNFSFFSRSRKSGIKKKNYRFAHFKSEQRTQNNFMAAASNN